LAKDCSEIRAGSGLQTAQQIRRVKATTPERWNLLWQTAGLEGSARQCYEELLALYGQSRRSYHTLGHINDCLTEFDAARSLAHSPIPVEFAIWFHDVIYDTHASDNEERSAEFAKRNLADAGASAGIWEAVVALITATRNHDQTLHQDAALIVDVDLAILGQPEPRFLEYEQQIRREYGWVPESVFCAKRAEILEHFLARPRIYTHEEFFGRYEQQARSNLQDSVRALKKGCLPG
jgi:predicted metal-dependent HD superfamily phosphohydrolase